MGTYIFIKELKNSVMDKHPQTAGSRKGLIFGAVQGIFLESQPVCFFQNGSIQSFFITEMIIDGGEVSTGPAADLPNRGLAETAGGKNLAGSIEEAFPGFGRSSGKRVFLFQFTVSTKRFSGYENLSNYCLK